MTVATHKLVKEQTLQNRPSHSKLLIQIASPPAVYFKDEGKPKKNKKPVDFRYRGNSNDIGHLVKHRLGPSANISQVAFETGLRNYYENSSRIKAVEEEDDEPKRIRHRKGQSQVSVFKTVWSQSKSNNVGFEPSFLPPLTDQGKASLRRNEIFEEKGS